MLVLFIMKNHGVDATHEPSRPYDVFLSFRAQDALFTFVGYLYNALREKKFKTFFLADELVGKKLGEPIFLSFFKVIEESRISIVVFTENYARSWTSLEELVKILDCKKTKNQLVFPVFYKVEPSDVMYQKNGYGNAMAIHEHRFGNDSEKVQRWRSTLSEVANLEGWHLGAGFEYQYIESIVEKVTQSLPRYDVFLSFRGLDTRYTFTGYLYDALHQMGYKTFMDDEGLEGGDEISPSLLQAIEQSRLSIVVLSENYAYSSWCLDELVKILECKKIKNQLVWPIFYRVEPSDVRHQKNSYREAMARHEDRFKNDSGKVHKWRSALSEVADLEGCHFETGYEYELIQRIVELVTQSLHRYDIILSFRGQDTRDTFTGYLYNALRQKGFKTFMDDELLEGGDQNSLSLLQVIEESRLSIIVFSENYAYSSWCLDELVKIIECMQMKNQLVWPIFYKVEPSDVRHQKNSYGKALAEHEDRFKNDFEKVQKWRSALSEAANLKGWHFETGYEYEFIQKIVERVTNI